MQELYQYQGKIFESMEELKSRIKVLHERWDLELLPCLIELSKKTKSDEIFYKEADSPNGILFYFYLVYDLSTIFVTEEVLCSLKFILNNLKPIARAKGNNKSSIDERLKMMICFVNVSAWMFLCVVCAFACVCICVYRMVKTFGESKPICQTFFCQLFIYSQS